MTAEAYHLVASGDLAGARGVLEEGLAHADDEPPAEVAEAASVYARVLLASGDAPRAREWAAYGHGLAYDLHGPADPRTVRDEATLAAAAHRDGDLAEAERLYRDVIARLSEHDGPDSTRTLAARADLATVLHARGDCVTARDELGAALDAYRRAYGPGAPAGIRMLARLAAMTRDCGEPGLAARMFNEARALCRTHLPPDDPVVAQVDRLAGAPPSDTHTCGPGGAPVDREPAGRAADAREFGAREPGGREFGAREPGGREFGAREPGGREFGAREPGADAAAAPPAGWWPPDHAGQPPQAGQPPDAGPPPQAGTGRPPQPPAPAQRAASEPTGPQLTGPQITGPQLTGPQLTGPPFAEFDQPRFAEPTGPIFDPAAGPPPGRAGSPPPARPDAPLEPSPSDLPPATRHLPVPRHGQEHATRRRWRFVLLAVVLAILGVVVGWLIASAVLRKVSAPQLVPGADQPAGAAQGSPTGVILRDHTDSVTLSWTYPGGAEGPVVVSGGRSGQRQQAFQTLPAGTTTYTVYGLAERSDYCFTVAVVYSTDVVARADMVCTARVPPGSPGRR